jgi:hypothetical protein
MTDYRKLIVALVIAILFAIFVQTAIEAVRQAPEYNDFCDERPIPLKISDRNNISPEEEAEQTLQREEMDKCNDEYRNAREEYNFVIFIVSAVLGLVAVLVGLYVSVSSPVGLSIASGLLLGGLVTIFIGTMRGWDSIGVTIRPFVILAELIIVILVSYRKLNDKISTKKKKK